MFIYFYLAENYFEGTENRRANFLQLAKKEICKGEEHLEALFQDIIDRGGEGVILRDPLAPHQPGRSSGYLKHKVPITQSSFNATSLFIIRFIQKFRDAEAKIVRNVDLNHWECEL